MSANKLLLILWLVVVVSGAASIFWGKSGMAAMNALESERDRLSANMEELRKINSELEGSLDSLRSDKDALLVRAREMGYAASADDRFVRIAGLSPATRRTANAGNMLRVARPKAVSDDEIRIIGTVCGIGLFILVLTRRPKNERQKRSVSGAPR